MPTAGTAGTAGVSALSSLESRARGPEEKLVGGGLTRTPYREVFVRCSGLADWDRHWRRR